MQSVGALRDGVTGENARAAGTVAESHDGGIEVEVDVLCVFLKVTVMRSGI